MAKTRFGGNKIAIIEAKKRRAKIRRDYMSGITSYQELAARHGISLTTVSADIAAFTKQFIEEDREVAQQQMTLAERRLMDVYRQASDGYERSKQDAEEISTVYTPRSCEACAGTGYRIKNKEKRICRICKGEGFTLAENVTRKVRGQAGDPQFLRIKIEVMRELNKMKGHYSDNGRLGSGNTFVSIKGDVDMEMVSKMDEKTLIKAMELLDEIKEGKPQEEEEPIDVEVRKIEGEGNTLS